MKLRKHFILLIAILFGGSLFAQVTTSNINGTVSSNKGETLPGATVIAIHMPSGTKYATVTNKDGRYNLSGLRVGGPYSLTATFVGQEKVTLNDIQLQLGETSVYDIQMSDKAQDLTGVTITAEKSAIFNSKKTGAATNFNRTAIERIPTVSRSVFDVTRLTPQAVTTGSGTSFAGANNKYNSFQIDGTANNDVFGLSASGTNGGSSGANPISLEAIEELQVVIAPFDVRQSGFTGGGINAITKSGTNTFHGSLYDFYNNQNFVGTTAGKNISDRKKLGEQSSNTFGFTIGGPIIKNKLFFFANYEKVNETYPSSWTIGNGSNITKDEVDQVVDKLKTLTGGYDGGGYAVQDIPTKSDKFLTRIDWNINDKHKFTVRYSYLNAKQMKFSNSPNSLSLNDNGYNMNDKTHSIVAELNSRFSSDLTNEFRFGYTSVRDNREILGTPFPYVKISLDKTNTRSIQLGTERYSTANSLDQDIYTIADNLSWLKGKHVFTFGTYNEFFKMKNLFIRENFGSYVYSSIADFLTVGTPSEVNPYDYNYSFSKQDVTGSKNWAPQFGAAQLSLYGQDDWSVSNLLKLTYGVRMDFPVFFDKPTENKVFNEIQTAKDLGVATNQLPKSTPLFSPRVGFRYNLDETRKTLFRGGVGIFTGRIPFVWISNSFSNTGIEYSRTRINKPADFDKAKLDGFKFQTDPNNQYAPKNALSSEIDVVDKNFKYPQVLRANLAVEQVLPFGIKGTLEGLWSKTLNNVNYKNIAIKPSANNLTNAGGDTRTLYERVADFSNYTSVIYLTNTNEGYTYSLTGKLEKNFDFGLNTMLAYTYAQSKGINDGTSSQAYSNWSYNEVYGGDAYPTLAYTDYDVRHRIVGSVSYRIEYAKHFATTVSLFYNGQSGSRYSLIYYGDINGDGATSNDLLYIPTDAELANMMFSTQNKTTKKYELDADQAASRKALGDWINANSDISEYKGKYIPRNGLLSEFEHHFDLHIAQDFYMNIDGRKHTLQLNLDVLNIGNLLNRAWGLYVQSSIYNFSPISYNTKINGAPTYSFTNPKDDKLYSISDYYSRWRAQIGIKFFF